MDFWGSPENVAKNQMKFQWFFNKFRGKPPKNTQFPLIQQQNRPNSGKFPENLKYFFGFFGLDAKRKPATTR